MRRSKPMTKESDVRGTPQDLYDLLDARFHFNLDVCANAENRKCVRFFDEAQDGLQQSWAGARVFCNPPYSGISAWVAKAWQSDAELAYLLLPGIRCEQPWWQELVEPFRDGRERFESMSLRTEFLPGRPRFTNEKGLPILDRKGKLQSPMFGLVGLVFQRTERTQ